VILPSKHIGFEQALIRVGADVLEALTVATTVTTLWTNARNAGQVRTFDQFCLALSFLFAVGAVELRDGLLVRTT
jgi:hypothetical protein